ncbi:hypothetical protein LEP1GSC170_5887, partial [Leptospira interrogans serovar Bataviae str. HAI135]
LSGSWNKRFTDFGENPSAEEWMKWIDEEVDRELFFWKPFILGAAHFTTKELENASTVLYMKMMEVVDRRKKEKPKKKRKSLNFWPR